MIKYSPYVSCDMNYVTGMNDIAKPCSVKITAITSNFKDVCINKPPLPNEVFDYIYTPIPCINNMDIDNIEGWIIT